MILRHAIIHELIKSVHVKDAPKEIPEIKEGNLLDIESEPVSSLVNNIYDIYGKKGNNSASGTFDESDSVEVKFKSYLDDFLYLDNPDEDIDVERDAFKAFSLLTMVKLKNKISDQNFATGGYIVFGHYLAEDRDIDSNGFLLVAMVKNKDGIILNNLVPEIIQPIDMSKLHQAIKINIEMYSSFYEAHDEERRRVQNYLTFISPKINETTSGYFSYAFDCINAISHSKSTKSAIYAVEKFFEQDDGLKPFRREAIDDIAQKLYDLSLSDDSECTLDHMDVWVNAHIPTELHEQFSDKFSTFANDEPHNVPASFMSNKSAAQSAMKLKIDAKDIGWRIDFDRTLLGDNEGAKIYFDSEEGTLTLTDLPEDIKNILKLEIQGEEIEE
jgi:nucleoid-associated protein